MRIFKKFDFLSPPISLYFNTKKTHTSKIGAILAIIMILLVFGYSSLHLYSVINRLNVISLVYKKFEWEAGFYPMNSTRLFHFFQIFSSEDGGYFDKYDSKFIRIYTTYVHNNLEQSQLHNYDHWVFEECREGIDNKDIDIDLFENIENFTNAACMRYYYNSKENKYYSVGDKGFIWPYLEHGISRRDNVYLTTMLEKCSNNSVLTKLLGNCASDESIEEYVKKYFGFYMYLLDNSVDPTNYTNPIQNYFQIISTGVGNSKTFVENYMHFSPVRMRTKEGDIFSSYTDINSFFFDFNRKGTAESYNKILLKNYYLMQNNLNIYERRYSGIFDLLSNIGGATQFLFYTFFIINYIYNRYIIIMDTNHFFCNIEQTSSEFNENRNQINPFQDFKNIFGGNDTVIKKTYKKQNFSLNCNFKGGLGFKVNNKKDNIAKNQLPYREPIATEIRRNNYLDNIIKKNEKNEKNKNSESNAYNDSFDYSNKVMKPIQEKRMETLDLLKEKNINSTQNNELTFNDDITKNIKIKNIINEENDSNKISVPPKKTKSVQFKENNKEYKKKNNKIIKAHSIKSSVQLNNINEIFKIEKLNKDMVKKSNFFEQKFSFVYYLFCVYKKREEFKNLYSLISFRKKILSENFIFQQHIINLILGEKCGITPQEIKHLL